MKPHVEWFPVDLAAARLGFLKADGSGNVNAFRVWRQRHPHAIRSYSLGGRLRFRAADLDRAIEAMPDEQSAKLRLVARDRR